MHEHAEHVVQLPVAPATAFPFLDDHARLSGHMGKSSWMMLGSSMDVSVDDGKAQRTGSIIRLDGRILGLRLHVEEVVAERSPPLRKTWSTIGTPALLVIGAYRMGFELKPIDGGSDLRVFIDYDLPESGVGRLLGPWLGGFYARWCTRQMAEDAKAHFEGTHVA